ncbi:MAG: YybH family protein [Burkholderiales bacterium]
MQQVAPHVGEGQAGGVRALAAVGAKARRSGNRELAVQASALGHGTTILSEPAQFGFSAFCVSATGLPDDVSSARETLRRADKHKRQHMSDIEKSIARVLESYKAAVYAKDVDAFMRLYNPDVRVFDAWGVWSYEGADAWQRAVEGWFTSLGTERVKVTFDAVKISEARESAVVSAVVTYASVSVQGEPLRSMQNRLTWALRVSGHVLRIAHEHTSAPIGFEDQKAILQR